MRATSRLVITLRWGFLGLVVLGVGAWGVARVMAPPPLTPERLVATVCQSTMRSDLKAPLTARFQPLEAAAVQPTTAPGIGPGWGRPIPVGSLRVATYVDAQNTFGAMIRTRGVCIFTPAGEILDYQFPA